jgi:hypothetical protein
LAGNQASRKQRSRPAGKATLAARVEDLDCEDPEDRIWNTPHNQAPPPDQHNG